MDAPIAKLALGMEGADVLVVQAEDSQLAAVEKQLRDTVMNMAWCCSLMRT